MQESDREERNPDVAGSKNRIEDREATVFEADYQQDETQPMPEKPYYELPVEQPTPGFAETDPAPNFRKSCPMAARNEAPSTETIAQSGVVIEW